MRGHPYVNAVTQQSARQLCCKLHAAPHLLLRYLTDACASDCNSTDVQSQGVQLVIPDVQGTVCMLDISRLVLRAPFLSTPFTALTLLFF